ncbi:hypothetical protein KDA_26360 [Dictyobacter alpinus]|uniref:Uncharacterized protein n=1 Tax=Dictyobacter alpinus TaxID=2014873 RepID=A0A402B753_9CHLR|nr:hypothetical protein [Dictyobacter alpinus]GCE27152.1 hypothetical protein KDA_26360 [Dictyobacter alpinus]
MYNDSIETLLLRHHGPNSTVPEGLEQRLCASIQRQAEATRQQQSQIRRLSEQRISRRRVVQLVALSSAGLGLLSSGIASIEGILNSQEGQQPAYS